jgi:hypothetical protein
VSAIHIVQFGFLLLSPLNVDGQALRRLEINVKDENTTVKIAFFGSTAVKKLKKQWFWGLFSSTSNIDDLKDSDTDL